MRPARWWCARGIVLAGLSVLFGAPALAAPASPLGRPELGGGVGGTFAILGATHQGGAALNLGARWPMGGPSSPVSLGFGLWAADAGQTVGRLLEPRTGLDLGAVGGPSLTAFGGGLTADLHPGLARTGETSGAPTGPYLSGAVGFYQVSSALRGRPIHADGSVGWNAGGGWRFRLGNRVTVGPSLHYHRLIFDDRLGRFMAAGLDWVWR